MGYKSPVHSLEGCHIDTFKKVLDDGKGGRATDRLQRSLSAKLRADEQKLHIPL